MRKLFDFLTGGWGGIVFVLAVVGGLYFAGERAIHSIYERGVKDGRQAEALAHEERERLLRDKLEAAEQEKQEIKDASAETYRGKLLDLAQRNSGLQMALDLALEEGAGRCADGTEPRLDGELWRRTREADHD